jgi:DNA mismatch endonuclease (patch repair protein)
MTDVLTEEQRKYNMSRIRGKDTSPELKIRKKLYSQGLRGYRVHYQLPGRPDITFTRYRIAVFIDGCYWHKCPECFTEPQTRREFWMNKINRNVERDKEINLLLESDGWHVLRFWEHQVRKDAQSVVDMIYNAIQIKKNLMKTLGGS